MSNAERPGATLPAKHDLGNVEVIPKDDPPKYPVASAHADLSALLSEAGTGMEEARPGDFIIPRLTILQLLSPQLNKKKADYIPGAEAGLICDTAAGIAYEGLLFLPVQYQKHFLEWAPRQSGKGLVRVHDSPDILHQTSPNEKGQPFLDNGNYIAETAQFLGFILDEAGPRPAFIAFSSTQLKKARRWLTVARNFRVPDGITNGQTKAAPLWFFSYKLGVSTESNNEGEWFGWSVQPYKNLHEVEAEYAHANVLLPSILELRESYKKGGVHLKPDEDTEDQVAHRDAAM